MNEYKVIRVYRNIQLMTGVGEEFLVDQYDEVIAVFWNGNMRRREVVNCDVEAETAIAV